MDGKNGKDESFLDLVAEVEGNPFADPERSRDGGGYEQPHRVWRGKWRGKALEVEVFDTSCGDFGGRWHMLVTLDRETLVSDYNAVDNSDPGDQCSCDRPLDDDLDEFIWKATGYRFNSEA